MGPSLSLQIPLWKRNPACIGAARGALALARAEEITTTARAAAEETRAAERLRIAEESLATLPADIAAEAAPAQEAVEKLFVSGVRNLSDTLLLRTRIVEGQRAWLEARAAIAMARIDVALARQSDSLLP